MDDNAMNYEYLIRRANQCGRHGVAGADADTFRRLQRLALKYNKNRTEKDLREYMVSAGEVSAYIKTACQLVIKKFDGKLSDDQYNELEEVMLSLIEPNLDKLSKAVQRAQIVMLEVGLYPK